MKSWYQIQNKGNSASISIHDEIGLWGVTAKDFIEELKQIDAKSINLTVNSPGGSVFDGLAMYNALKGHPANIHGSVLGIAASAASFVLMSADTITMPEDAFMMIHNPWTFAMGDSEEMRTVADMLDKIQGTLVSIYARRTGNEAAAIADMMAEETWMNSEQALELNFIDSISAAINVAAKATSFDRYFDKLPFDSDPQSVDSIQNIKDFERHLRDAGGFTRGQATALASRAKALFKQGDPVEAEAKQIQQLSAALMRFKVPESLT